jgi:hypothetical protein
VRISKILGVSPAFSPCPVLSARIFLQLLPCPRNAPIFVSFLSVGIVSTKASKDELKSDCGDLLHIYTYNIE